MASSSSSAAPFANLVIEGRVNPDSPNVSDVEDHPEDLLFSRFRQRRPRSPPSSPSSAPSVAGAPVAMDVDTEYLPIGSAIIKSAAGEIFKTLGHTLHNILPNDLVWKSGTEPFQVEILPITRDTAKNKIWVIAKLDHDSNPGLTIGAIAAKLFAGAPEIGAIIQYEPNAYMLVVRKRRNNMSMFGDFEAVEFFSMSPADHHLKALTATNTVLFLKAILNSNYRVLCNYILTPSKTEQDWVAQAVEMFADLDSKEREMTIARAKNTKVSERTEMQHCISKCHVHIMNAQKVVEENDVIEETLMRPVNDKSIKVWKDFGLAHVQMVWTFDVVTGQDIVFNLREFVKKGWHRTHSLVLLGDASFGKSVAAESICAKLCKGQQVRDGMDRFFLTVATVDLLRKVQQRLVPGTSILFDDVTVSALRGSRVKMELDMIKHLTNVRTAEGLDCRNHDIVIPKKCARIFTTNADTPFEWCNELTDVKGMAPADRLKKCSAHGLALYKRCAFAQVLAPFITHEESEAYLAALRAEGARAVAGSDSDSDSL